MGSFIRFLLRKYRSFRRWYKEIWSAKRKLTVNIPEKIPFLKKVKYNRLGFTDDEYFCYHLDVTDYKKYISRWERLSLEDLNGRYAPLLAIKVLFENLAGKAINVPHIYSWIHNGKIYDLKGNTRDDFFLNLLIENRSMIAKPTKESGCGRGVLLLEYVDGVFKINDKKLDTIEFIDYLHMLDEYIITQRIMPGSLSKDIFPKTANTIRVVTAMINGKAEALLAVHRFGTEKSFPVDGGAYGGILAYIDLETGRLRKARKYSGEEFSNHPDTGTLIEGVEIPNWKYIIDEIKHAHDCMPYYEFFAWDAVVADDGMIYALEINRGTDVEFLQLEVGQRNMPFGKYVRSKGCLKKW